MTSLVLRRYLIKVRLMLSLGAPALDVSGRYHRLAGSTPDFTGASPVSVAAILRWLGEVRTAS